PKGEGETKMNRATKFTAALALLAAISGPAANAALAASSSVGPLPKPVVYSFDFQENLKPWQAGATDMKLVTEDTLKLKFEESSTLPPNPDPVVFPGPQPDVATDGGEPVPPVPAQSNGYASLSNTG